jgi:hypothetical protein
MIDAKTPALLKIPACAVIDIELSQQHQYIPAY